MRYLLDTNICIYLINRGPAERGNSENRGGRS